MIAYQHFPDEWPFPYLARQIFELNGPSPGDEDYFCVEPVSHVTDAFNLLDRGDLGTGAKILLLDEIL